MTLIFLDTETTGLDPALHEVWEVAWAVDDEPIVSRFLPHDLRTADPEALRINGYWGRVEEGMANTDHLLRSILAGATVVGSNPAFDTAFLRARWGVAPWHHRLLAVESMAFAVMGYATPKGLAGVASDLRDAGYEIPEPDHTAAGDVATLRAVFHAIREVVANR